MILFHVPIHRLQKITSAKIDMNPVGSMSSLGNVIITGQKNIVSFLFRIAYFADRIKNLSVLFHVHLLVANKYRQIVFRLDNDLESVVGNNIEID
jgi:hypothetical protein